MPWLFCIFNDWRNVSINVHIRKHVVSVNKASYLFLLCLINDRGIYPTFSGFARASSYIIFSVRSLFKSYFLGVRSEFNTHNPAICQAYFLPLPHQNLTIGKLLYLYKTFTLKNFDTLPKPKYFLFPFPKRITFLSKHALLLSHPFLERSAYLNP